VVQYSVGLIIIIHGRSTIRKYMDRLGNQVHPMIHTFLNKNAVFHDNTASFHTDGTVHSWFKEH
jgi:hypothetical protein